MSILKYYYSYISIFNYMSVLKYYYSHNSLLLYIFIHLVIYNIMMLLFGVVSYKSAAAAAGVICLFVYY